MGFAWLLVYLRSQGDFIAILSVVVREIRIGGVAALSLATFGTISSYFFWRRYLACSFGNCLSDDWYGVVLRVIPVG